MRKSLAGYHFTTLVCGHTVYAYNVVESVECIPLVYIYGFTYHEENGYAVLATHK